MIEATFRTLSMAAACGPDGAATPLHATRVSAVRVAAITGRVNGEGAGTPTAGAQPERCVHEAVVRSTRASPRRPKAGAVPQWPTAGAIGRAVEFATRIRSANSGSSPSSQPPRTISETHRRAMDAAGPAENAQIAFPTGPWKTLRVFHKRPPPALLLCFQETIKTRDAPRPDLRGFW